MTETKRWIHGSQERRVDCKKTTKSLLRRRRDHDEYGNGFMRCDSTTTELLVERVGSESAPAR